MSKVIDNGATFEVAGIEFIKFPLEDGKTAAVAKDILFRSTFGDDNNFTTSKIFKKLQTEFLPKIIEAVGEENVCEFETDLTTLDGLKPYPVLKSKISLCNPPRILFCLLYICKADEQNPDFLC